MNEKSKVDMDTGGRPSQLRQLQARIDEFEFVVRHIRQGIWRLDGEGRILFANPFLASWLETTPQRMAGQLASEFIGDRTPSPDTQASNHSDRYEATFFTANGLVRHGIVVSATLQESEDQAPHTIQLITDISADHAVQRRLVSEVQRMASLASSDMMTGLSNRRAFEAELLMAAEKVDTKPFGLILLDLDGLKEINDRLGHQAGDEAIKAFAQRLEASVRSEDRVARIGGDEFAVLVHGAERAELSEIYGRLTEKLLLTEQIGGTTLTLHASSGWAHSDEGIDRIVQLADEALYRVKRHHKIEGSGPTLL